MVADAQGITCPKCGHENDASAMNCANCRVNLEWALKEKDRWAAPEEQDQWAAAYVIDCVIIFIVGYVVGSALGVVYGVFFALCGHEFTFNEARLDMITMPLNLALYVTYFTAFEWLGGASPGKLILGMRVVKEDSTACDFPAALLRALMRFIDGLFFGVVAAVTMKPPFYQRLGDSAAKTIVVKATSHLVKQPRPGWMFLLAAALYLAVLAGAVGLETLIATF
jgi:uncharacterized RDD family membrane protein YckC